MLYKKWLFECQTCQKTVEFYGWEDKVPTKCKCGGRLYDTDTGKRVGMTQQETILVDLGELDA